MKSHSSLKKVLLLGCALGAHPAQASLADLNNGLIYDFDSDLVWLQDANYLLSQATAPADNGARTWDDASQWVSDLNYDADGAIEPIGGWRLPTLAELAHLLGSELNGVQGTFLSETTPFYDFVAGGRYWTSTETVLDSQEHAWTINGKLQQGTQIKSEAAYVWAVRANNGLLPVPQPIPVPSMLWPFSGLLALLISRRKYQQ